MNILVTGANGYIGRRLIDALLSDGHRIYGVMRRPDQARQLHHEREDNFYPIQADLDQLKPDAFADIDIDAAYYLVHGMNSKEGNLVERESRAARDFSMVMKQQGCRQIIYLGGITPPGPLSDHLASRLQVEQELKSSGVALTTLKSAIVVGSGSASFEIMRDLVEKLPIMIAPRWLNSRCQPIAVRDCIGYLVDVLGKTECFNRSFDIAGPDVMTYRDMLLTFARKRFLRRLIIPIPLLTPKLSSLWLTLVTAVPFSLSRNLVNSLVHDMVADTSGIQALLPRTCLNYEQSLDRAFERVQSDNVFSRWSDGMGHVKTSPKDIFVPFKGCFKDIRIVETPQPDKSLQRVWSIGGKHGWYCGSFLWKCRGIIDKMIGGVGLRRGRRNQYEISSGDVIDFWRVLLADHDNRRLLLYAEMKLPGEAWLEFKLVREDKVDKLVQVATFRPRGLLGRLYWYSVLPLHSFIFPGMAKAIALPQPNQQVDPCLKSSSTVVAESTRP